MTTIDDIRAANDRISSYVRRTPLLEAPLLNEILGGRLLFKPEVLQKTGSFKIRGATNKIAQIAEQGTAKAIVAFSSGNHAQGVATAAARFGLPATIVMPSDAPAIKIANTKALGASVVTYDRYTEDREEIGLRIERETGAALVKPYDDPDIIAGQGTVGLEISEQCKELDVTPNFVAMPIGGGGLCAGICVAIHDQFPDTELYAAEPEILDDVRQSLEAGKRVLATSDEKTICDAIVTPMPGELTFEINQRLLTGACPVSDNDVLNAMKTAFTYLKVVVEPGGAAALAAVLAGKIDIKGRTGVVVLSGGNVDAEVFSRALNS